MRLGTAVAVMLVWLVASAAAPGYAIADHNRTIRRDVGCLTKEIPTWEITQTSHHSGFPAECLVWWARSRGSARTAVPDNDSASERYTAAGAEETGTREVA